MPPKKIGKYEVQQIIGEGSFGKVYLGVCDNEQYALKFIPKRSCQYKDIVKLKMEVDLLSKLKHLNIIHMKQCLQTESELIVVMEYAGTDLSQVLRKEKKLSEDKLRNYAKQILNAMLYLKDSRIMHRDLKPQNILLQKDIIKICDFGFAKKLSASTQFLRSIKGTPLYIAPQILMEKPYTDKVDVWSFGIILFELATGRPPFMASTIQQLKPKIFHQPVVCPSSMNPLLSQLIKGMLQKRDVMRYSWQQVKSHKYFTESIRNPAPVLPVPEQNEDKIKIEEVLWDAEQQCAYINKVDSQVQYDKVKLLQLKENETFWQRVINMIGQACHDRKKVPTQALMKTLKLATKLIMLKRDPKDNQKEDISKKKSLNAAIVSLAIQQKNQELLEAELQLIGFLLKINFDGHKIDTQYDELITTITSQHLKKKKGGSLTVKCLKVLGILTSQAVWTLSQSYEYFDRISKEKLVTCIAQCYNVIPESHIVLQCLQKFIHPRIQRHGTLTYKVRATFKSLKQEVAPILLKNKFISDASLMNRSWKKPVQLQTYCEILLQCLLVSSQFRNEFLKYNYWQQLLAIKNTKIYYLAYVYIILKQTGKVLLSSQKVQSEIVQEQSQNKFTNVFLIYLAYHKFRAHQNNSKVKLQKVKFLVNNIGTMLLLDSGIKKKYCNELFGSQAQESDLFDDILIEVIHNIYKQYTAQQIKTPIQTLATEILNLSLSNNSLIKIIEIFQTKKGLQIGEQQSNRLSQLFFENIRNDSFEDYMSVYPNECSKLISYLLSNQLNRMNEQREKENAQFLEIVQKNNFIQILFNEHVSGQFLMLTSLRLINRLTNRLKMHTLTFLSDSGLQIIKKYFHTTNEDLILQIVIFCSILARISKENVIDLLQAKIVEFVSRCLNQGNELIKQKTLHLVGNLSKHNQSAFKDFQNYGIISSISHCLNHYRQSRRILKNAIYCIGNISYYSDRFAQDLGPIIRCLRDGLNFEDQNLLQNTLSTISNMLRHSDVHVAALREGGVLARVIQIYDAAASPQLVNLCNNLLKKALQKPNSYDENDRVRLKATFDKHMRKRLLDVNNQNSKRMLQALA